MKIVLIRHVKSDWSAEKTDFDRPIREDRKADALKIVQALKAKGIAPGLMITSPAKRTLQTAKLFAKAFDYTSSQIEYAESLYEDSLPDFIKLAEAYGHVGIRVTKKEDLKAKLEECFALKDRVVFMDIMVDQSEHVYPMQVRGGAMNEMILSKPQEEKE